MSGPYRPVWSPDCAILISIVPDRQIILVDDEEPLTITGTCLARRADGSACGEQFPPMTVTAEELRAVRGHFQIQRACPRCENILTIVLEGLPVRGRR